MKRRGLKIKTNFKIFLVGCLLAICGLPLGCGTISFPALDEPVDAGSLPVSTGEYGKFIIYKVGEGEIKSLCKGDCTHGIIYYHLTDYPYKPVPGPAGIAESIITYNADHPCGDGYTKDSPPVPDPGQSIFYKDKQSFSTCGGRQIRSSSDHPEAINISNQLFFYYTNYPVQTPDSQDHLNCKCMGDPLCLAQDGGLFYDFPDHPDSSVKNSVLNNFNCGAIITMSTPNNRAQRLGPQFATPDTDWISIPASAMALGQMIPLKIRLMGDQLNMAGTRIIKMDLYETAPGAKPNLAADKPVASNRFGFDFYRSYDPVLGYLLKPDRDYWLEVSDWSFVNMPGYQNPDDFMTLVYFESTPVLPISWDPTSAIYKAGLKPAKSGNPALNNGPFFEPDDVTTRLEDFYPDCDGIPNSGDEGDWGIYEICPVEGNVTVGKVNDIGLKDGAIEYQEVDNKANIDDGEYFAGAPTSLSSMGNEAPSLIQVGGSLWMFISTGSGIFQINSKDGLAGMQWDLSNIINNRPSLLPRKMDPAASGDPNAPVVSSGRHGRCETTAKGDDVQLIPKGKGYTNAVCLTFGENGMMDSYPMEDDLSSGVINSGPDGIINTWHLPSCTHYGPPVYGDNNFQRKSGAYGNPDLFCGDSVTGSNDHTAFLFGDDRWLTNEIGLNPAEYWRRQNCNVFTMAEEFNRCALGKSNSKAAVVGGGGALYTVMERMEGDDYLCHNGNVVGICPGPNNKFDQSGVQDTVNMLKSVVKGDDYLCEINPAGGLEYARFNFGDTHRLKHDNIVGYTEKVVSFILQKAGQPAVLNSAADDYRINYLTGEITIGSHNWLQAINGDPRKDVLIVYYRYQGSQTAICPGPNGVVETPYYFYVNYEIPDRRFAGPPVQLPAFLGGGLVTAPGLADVPVGSAAGSSITWDPTSVNNFGSFVCSGTDCPVSPGSDNTLDAAWVRDAEMKTGTLIPYFMPHRFDLYGQFDDWLCPIDGQMALCPGGNGYSQSYRLYTKVEMKRFNGVDDVLQNFENPNNSCYELEIIEERSHFYKNDESVYVLNAYQGVIGDDRVAWDPGTLSFYVTTGTNGINQSCISSRDYQLIPRFKGQPYQPIINGGANGTLETKPLKDELIFIDIESEKPLPKIIAGDDGVCNSFKIFDDRSELFFGSGAPDYPCVLAGPNGIADTPAQGNDSQLYLPGEKTGFDSFAVDTPEVVADGNKLFLFYSGVGWMRIPHSVPPSRGAFAKNGECKRPGLDNRWGNTTYSYSTGAMGLPMQERGFVAGDDGRTNETFIHSLDDNQGVMIAPRIGVATSTIERIAANPSDWSRVSTPALDVSGICGGALAGALGNFSLGSLSVSTGVGVPPTFNYFGSFSPEVLIKHNAGNNQPIFMMWLTGIYATKNDGGWGNDDYFSGLYKPDYQIGLARSTDGLSFDLANDINPLIVTGDLLVDFTTFLGGGEKAAYLNPTVFPGSDEETYGMIFKMAYNPPETSKLTYPSVVSKTTKDWLAFGVRNGFLYGGGISGLLSCKINSSRLTTGQGIYNWSASLILILPVVAVLVIRMRIRKSRKD